MKKITIFFGIIFVVATVILVGLGFLEVFTIQSDYDNGRVERYEKMKLKDAKAVLTDNTIEEDHRAIVEYTDRSLDFRDKAHMGVSAICAGWSVFVVLVFLSILANCCKYVFIRTFFLSVLVLAVLAGSAYVTKVVYNREKPYPVDPNFDYVKETYR